MRKALIIWIDDYYNSVDKLYGCVEDAISLSNLLKTNSNGDPNFSCLTIKNKDESNISNLKRHIKNLFDNSRDVDIALFYFSGHGFLDSTTGYLTASDTKVPDEGISMKWLLDKVNQSKIKNKIIILDCCNSGAMGDLPNNENLSDNSLLSIGTTILTASRQSEPSVATIHGSVFTNLLLEALNGGASDILGNITSASIYSYIDKALGPWNQRPVFKTNISKFISLRNSQPLISKERLRKIIKYFKSPYDIFYLNPSFEEKSENPNKDNVMIFKDLQKYRDIGLVIAVDEEYIAN